MDNIAYSWHEFDKDTHNLCSQIKNKSWEPDFIIGIKRGGLVPATKISHLLDKPLMVISYQSRDSSRLDIDLLEVSHLPLKSQLLLVDDICDSGDTLQKIFKRLTSLNFEFMKSCSLYYNPSQLFKVDFYEKTIDRRYDQRWVIFPWESTTQP